MQQRNPATDESIQRLAKQWQELVGIFAAQNCPELYRFIGETL